MKKNSRIYVAGHTGFIGGEVTRQLKASGYKNIILKAHKELDLTDQKKTEKFFVLNKPQYVFLLAARVGGINANNTYPSEFIYDNLAIQSNVIHAAYKYKAKKLLFLGSACMYPKFCQQPIKPKYLLTGKIEPTNEPFAVAKIAGVSMCQAYNRQYKTNFISAVPATVYGPRDHFDNNGHVVAGLLEKYYCAAINKKNEIAVWGTGKPKREFLFIEDAASACIFIMKHYSGNELLNIGSKQEFSIKELAAKIANFTGFKGKTVYDKSRPDGIPRRLLDSSRMFSLGWKPKVAMDDGLSITYNWYKDSLNNS